MKKMTKNTNYKIRLFLSGLAIALCASTAQGDAIDTTISPYTGLTDTPSFADVNGDGCKALVYTTRVADQIEDTRDLMILRDGDGDDLNGWPYIFPEDERCDGGMAIYDIRGIARYPLAV
jgi:hypothetical protein